MNIIGRDFKLKTTTTYSKFSTLPMNRGIGSNHILGNRFLNLLNNNYSLIYGAFNLNSHDTKN
jgi:hypothetical protein